MTATVIDDGQFQYQVQFSARRRSVALQIKQGQLTVRAPVGISLEEVKNLVDLKQRWIVKHLKQSIQLTKPDWLALGKLPMLGNQLSLDVRVGTKSAVALAQDTLLITVSSRCRTERRHSVMMKLIQQWYCAQALNWCCQRVRYWQEKMALQAGDIVIGNWKAKWGYCKHNTELGFNWRLLMAPQWVADYVIVHELVHLTYFNHSAQFWQLVEHHYPDARVAERYLKQNQHWMTL